MALLEVKILVKEYLDEIIISLVASAIIAIMTWLYNLFLKTRKKYAFLLGEFIGYYLIKNDTLIFQQNIKIYINLLGRLKISIEEVSDAHYIYTGVLYFEDDRLFGFLKGQEHKARSFVSMILPFNRSGQVQSFNGIFAGITQDKYPAAIKVHWSRHPKSEVAIRTELQGQQQNFIIVKNDTLDNNLRKDVNETLKR